jgi:hypothetical protein
LSGAKPQRPRLELVVTPSAAPGPEPIRWSRVRTARARVAAGYYDRADVMERLATAVLAEIEHPRP